MDLFSFMVTRLEQDGFAKQNAKLSVNVSQVRVPCRARCDRASLVTSTKNPKLNRKVWFRIFSFFMTRLEKPLRKQSGGLFLGGFRADHSRASLVTKWRI